jgi:hypothetical protein
MTPLRILAVGWRIAVVGSFLSVMVLSSVFPEDDAFTRAIEPKRVEPCAAPDTSVHHQAT